MTKRRLACLGLTFLAAVTVLGGCRPAPAVVTILHLNDVYEIGPVEGGKAGGLARVATVIADLKRRSAAAMITLGGDYLSPSAIGTARVDGQPLAGRQMVAVLNAAGVEWVTFGNHEFDVSEPAFHARLAEGKFTIVSSNVTAPNGQPFEHTQPSAIVSLRTGGRDIRIGLIGLTINENDKPWVSYHEPIKAAQDQIGKLAGKVDAIVALTHLSLAQDQVLVENVPEIDLVLGGHEHENWLIRRGPHMTPIIKADANVRTLAAVAMVFGSAGARPTVTSELIEITDAIPADSGVDAEVKKWTTMAFDGFARDGFTPNAAVTTLKESLDGRGSTVRNRSDALTDLIAASLAREAGKVDAAIFNSGSIRIDDELPPGPITEYDVIRILPFGGKVLKATFDGALLTHVLDVGVLNRGTGGYLQTWGVTRDARGWLVQDKPVNPSGRYTVAINDFLLTGQENKLAFLTRTNPQVHDIKELRDVRRALIEELKKR